jgi:hypothetical protein
MIHENKDEFIKALGRASKKKGFLLHLQVIHFLMVVKLTAYL